MEVINHEYSTDHFHQQLDWVLNSYKPHQLKSTDFNNVVIGGLGGSGIGGRITKSALFTASPVPVEVYSEYQLPAYANSKTLVVLSSYSGNTEETLSMFADAKKKGCKIVCITSGGRLQNMAAEEGLICYPIPAGYQPRMALGFSLTTLLLFFSELYNLSLTDALRSASVMLSNNADLKAEAKSITEKWSANPDRKTVIVCDYPFEAVATRFCQQLQENTKVEGFTVVLPEANHNVIETYYGEQDTHFLFLNSGLNPRVNLRFEFLKKLLSSHNAEITEISHSGFNLEAIFKVIHITDWVSIFLSNVRGVNNMEVGNIVKLKAFLDELNVKIS